jgi:hypothetical protein
MNPTPTAETASSHAAHAAVAYANALTAFLARPTAKRRNAMFSAEAAFTKARADAALAKADAWLAAVAAA